MTKEDPTKIEDPTKKEMSNGFKTATFAAMSALDGLEFPHERPEVVESLSVLLSQLEDFQLLCKIQYLNERIIRRHKDIDTLQNEKAKIQAQREENFMKRD